MKTTTLALLGWSMLLSYSCSKSDDEVPFISKVKEPATVESKIIYTNIEPDFSSNQDHNSFILDLNQDGIMDFKISYMESENDQWLEIGSYPDVDNGILSTTPWYAHPVAQDEGALIFHETKYSDGESYEKSVMFAIGYCFPGHDHCNYDWKDKENKYVGVRLWIENAMYYGWIGMEIKGITEWTVKDFAINITPNMRIYAGQKE